MCFFLFSSFTQGQEPVSIHISERDGLPDKEFYDIIEDDKGFIWLAADKGLFRYDGEKYKSYKNKLQRGLSVFGLQKDVLKRVWCNNISGQFFYVENDQFILFTDLSKQLKGELADFRVTKKFVWVFTNRDIYKVNIKTKQIINIFRFNKAIGAPSVFKDNIYFESKDSIFYITSKNNLIKLGGVKPIKISEKAVFLGKSKIFKTKLSSFITLKKKGKNTFFQFNSNNRKNEKITDFKLLGNKRIYSEFQNDNQLWFATNSGVWLYQYKNKNFVLKKRFFKNLNVTKIIKDKDSNYWFTTLNNGVFIIPNIFIEKENISSRNKNITCLDKVNDSTLVFGTIKGVVVVYNTINNTEKNIKLPTDYRVSTLKYHPFSNSVFISTDKGGYKLNMKTLQLKQIEHFSTVKSIVMLGNDNILYADYKRVRLIKRNKISSDLVKNRRSYAAYYLKRSQDVFVAYVDDLVVYDSLFKPKTIKYKTKNILGNSITKTNDGIIWVATFKDGVYGIRNNTVIKHYSYKNGLSSDNILKINADGNDLWIATSNSLQVLNTITNKIKTLTIHDGILSYDISGIEIINDKIYLSSGQGLLNIHKEKCFKTLYPDVYFNTFEINERDTIIANGYKLNYKQNTIKIGFNVNGFLFNQKEKYQYRLKGINDKWLTKPVGENSIKYNSLPPGKYTFEVRAFIKNSLQKNKIKSINFTITKPFWDTWWFLVLIVCVFLGSIIFYFNKKIKEKERERILQLEKVFLEKELISQNLTALRSQMNPHFIFNALNSIQDLVLQEDVDASYDYIVLFSKLIRSILNYSNQDFISIEKELEFLNVYLELEKLRYGDDFSYNISFKGDKNIEVPSLLIQPFIENALLHGLMHKTKKKELSIVFSFINNTLQCVITDNGIGREKAKEIRKRQGNHYKSFALNTIKKRLKIFKKQYGIDTGYYIEDLYNNGIAIGTKVVVKIPFRILF